MLSKKYTVGTDPTVYFCHNCRYFFFSGGKDTNLFRNFQILIGKYWFPKESLPLLIAILLSMRTHVINYPDPSGNGSGDGSLICFKDKTRKRKSAGDRGDRWLIFSPKMRIGNGSQPLLPFLRCSHGDRFCLNLQMDHGVGSIDHLSRQIIWELRQ